MIKLDISQAIQILDALGSSDDPIIFRGESTTPNGIPYDFHIDDTKPASEIRIQFWIADGKRTSGSLHTMVRERLGLNIKRIEIKEPKEVIKTYHLYEWGTRGSEIFHPEEIAEIQKDTGVSFSFSGDSFVDYSILTEEIVQQLTDQGFKCKYCSGDDIIIKINIPNKHRRE